MPLKHETFRHGSHGEKPSWARSAAATHAPAHAPPPPPPPRVLGREYCAELLGALGLAPLLTLGLRLGEGSGAALAIQVLRGALACHSEMATFAEAGVSAGDAGP